MNDAMKVNTVLAIGILLLGVIIGGYLFKQNQALGSVAVTNEYNSTSTSPAGPNDRVLKPGPGTLGSVIITGANTGTMTIYDATTTNVTKRTGNIATTSLEILADFPASTAAGTYTYDTLAEIGILFVASGSEATSTITYR